MSDYEVTLVNDNSKSEANPTTLPRNRASTANLGPSSVRPRLREVSPGLPLTPSKARVLRAIQGASRKLVYLEEPNYRSSC